MRNRKNDIEKYLRGELSPAEMHALEREALNDPFLAEALEGIAHAGTENFLYDLHKLNKSVHHRVRARLKKSKIIKMGWTMGIAATVLLLALSGFLLVSLLKDQKSQNLAMEEQTSGAPAANQPSDTIELKLEDDVREAPSEEKEAFEAARPNEAAKAIKPGERTPGQIEDITEREEEPPLATEQTVADEIIETDQEEIAAAEISKTPHQVTDPGSIEAKKDITQKTEGRAADVKAQKRAAAGAQAALSESRLITGNVISAEDGEALPGVNVSIEGTRIGTVTDARGNYQLQLPNDKSKLVFSFIGFESQQVPVTNADQVNVELPANAAQLSEVVITNYGRSTDEIRSKTGAFRFAEPLGGKSDYKKYLSAEMKYPEAALKNKTEGKVTIRFTVEPDGQMKNFEVVKGIGHGCDEELIRLVREGPAWKSSTQNGQPVRDKVKVRFKFELPEK